MEIGWDPLPTRPGALQWFREMMEHQGVQVQVFMEPDTELELACFVPTPRLRREIERLRLQQYPLPSPTKEQTSLAGWVQVQDAQQQAPLQPAAQRDASHPPTSPRSSQAYGSEIAESIAEQLEDSLQADPGQVTSIATYNITVSNRNGKRLKRRAEKRLQRENARGVAQRKEKGARRVTSAEYVDSDLDSDSGADIDGQERLSSEAKAWFRMQKEEFQLDVLKTDRQREIYRAARVIAGKQALLNWQDWLNLWQKRGLIRSRPPSRGGAGAELAQQSPQVRAFWDLLEDINMQESRERFMQIRWRCRMAELHRVYLTIEPSNAIGNSGVGEAARRKKQLFLTKHPEFGSLASFATNPVAKRQWKAFSTSLYYARRWHAISEQFGAGILGLIPPAKVPQTWVHNLKKEEFEIWLRAIRHFNPGCLESSVKWTREITRALTGQSPSKKLRQLESVAGHGPDGVANTQALFCIEGSTSGDEEAEVPEGATMLAFYDTMGDVGLSIAGFGAAAMEFREQHQGMVANYDPRDLDLLGFEDFSSQETTLSRSSENYAEGLGNSWNYEGGSVTEEPL
jgi:hypothetical protein